VGRPDQGDWIQLKSGEWLKGRIKSLQEEKLEFDSAELDLMTFDWEDIHVLRSARPFRVLFDDRAMMLGPILVTTNSVLVGGPEPTDSARSNLLAIAPGARREIDNWSGEVSGGLTFRQGNTRQVEYNAHALIRRRTPATRFTLEYLGNFGKVDHETTANNHRITGEFDYFVSRRLFLVLPYMEYYRDSLQNLDHRFTVGAGVGYDLIKNRRVEWNVIGGPAYQRNWYSSVAPAEDREHGAAAMVLGTLLDVELTHRLDLTAEWRAQITREEVGETTHHSRASLEFEIKKHLDLDVSFIWDRISNPQPDAAGNVPAQDDFRLILGLGIDF
jgi:hypothetical protein